MLLIQFPKALNEEVTHSPQVVRPAPIVRHYAERKLATNGSVAGDTNPDASGKDPCRGPHQYGGGRAAQVPARRFARYVPMGSELVNRTRCPNGHLNVQHPCYAPVISSTRTLVKLCL